MKNVQFVKVIDLPDIDSFQTSSKEYIDIGYSYTQTVIFFFPIWKYDYKWCGYIDDYWYVDLSKEDLQRLANQANVVLPNEIPVTFWGKYNGLILLVLFILAIILRVKLVLRRFKNFDSKDLVYSGIATHINQNIGGRLYLLKKGIHFSSNGLNLKEYSFALTFKEIAHVKMIDQDFLKDKITIIEIITLDGNTEQFIISNPLKWSLMLRRTVH